MKPGFVVLTYNRPDALLAVLRELAPQCPPDAVVVIADDGSRPDTLAALRSGLPAFSCRVRHVWHPDVGFTAARARNLGALHAQADYLVFLDGDCMPASGLVAGHMRLSQAGHFVNGSRVLLSERLTGAALRGEIAWGRLTMIDWLRLRLAGDVNKLTHILHWPTAPARVQDEFRWKGIRSCNFGVWYGDLQAVNGFDETFSGWGHEDADLVLRLHHHGCRRKNGRRGVEVYHLWHPENNRGAEDANRKKVVGRMGSGITRAEIGLDQALGYSTTIVTELN